jgi:hypothetical protein
LIAALAAAALVAAGGGAWAFIALRDVGGAASPEEAAELLLNDAVKLNSVKITSRLAPSERAIGESWRDLIQVFVDPSDNPNPEASKARQDLVGALTIELSGIKFASQPLATGVSRTALAEGSVRIDANVDQLTDAILDLTNEYGDSLVGGDAGSLLGFDPSSMTRSELRDSLDELLPIQKDISDLARSAEIDDLFVVTVEEGAKWYTSVTMTAAQYIYEASGPHAEPLGDVIPADQMKGADRPEDAASNLLAAIDAAAASSDLRELARALPLAESRLLAVYGPALSSDLAIGDVFNAFSITSLTTSEAGSGDGYSRQAIDTLGLEMNQGDQLSINRDGTSWDALYSSIDSGAKVKLSQPDRQTLDLSIGPDDASSFESTMSVSVKIPSKGVLEVEIWAEGEQYSFNYPDDCSGTGDRVTVNPVCGPDSGFDPSELGLDELSDLPDLRDLISLTALKESDEKWYISLLASPTAIVALGAVVVVSALSSFSTYGGGFADDFLGSDDYSDDWSDDSPWGDEFGDDWSEDFPWGDEFGDDWDDDQASQT